MPVSSTTGWHRSSASTSRRTTLSGRTACIGTSFQNPLRCSIGAAGGARYTEEYASAPNPEEWVPGAYNYTPGRRYAGLRGRDQLALTLALEPAACNCL